MMQWPGILCNLYHNLIQTSGTSECLRNIENLDLNDEL